MRFFSKLQIGDRVSIYDGDNRIHGIVIKRNKNGDFVVKWDEYPITYVYRLNELSLDLTALDKLDAIF